MLEYRVMPRGVWPNALLSKCVSLRWFKIIGYVMGKTKRSMSFASNKVAA